MIFKIVVLCDLPAPHMGYSQKKGKQDLEEIPALLGFISTLLTTAKKWELSQSSFTDKWLQMVKEILSISTM